MYHVVIQPPAAPRGAAALDQCGSNGGESYAVLYARYCDALREHFQSIRGQRVGEQTDWRRVAGGSESAAEIEGFRSDAAASVLWLPGALGGGRWVVEGDGVVREANSDGACGSCGAVGVPQRRLAVGTVAGGVSDRPGVVGGVGEVASASDVESSAAGDETGVSGGATGVGGVKPAGSGPNWAANRKRRLGKAARKARKKSAVREEVSKDPEVEELRASLRRKWKAQNDLETLKAEQALEVAKRTDLEQLVRCKRAKLVKATEQSFVAIEKAHGTLVATGNVPGVNPSVVPEPGFAKTVVDGSGVPTLVSGSISPDSSVSAAEVRRMQKDLEDMRAKFAAIGIDPDKFKPEKVDWTLDSKGGFVEQEALDETYPDGYAFVNENRGPEDCDPDGKVRVRVVRSGWLGER